MLSSVRLRTTGVAVAIVGVGLIVGVVGLVVSLRGVMLADVRGSLALQAAEAVRTAEAGGDPAAAVAGDDDVVLQIVDSQGQITAATPNAGGKPPFATGRVRVDDDAYLITAAQTHGGNTILIGRSLDALDDSTAAVGTALAVGVPLLLLMVGTTTWRMVGRALAPVEAIRAEVDAISTTQLHRRVPEPGTGDEIGRLAATMNRMLDRLESASARQRQFVADASHELRSPIASMRQYAEVELAHPGAAGDLAAVTREETARMQLLVDDLLLLAQADERALRRRPVDLDELVLAEDATASVAPIRVEADRAALQRVLHNLGKNARRHARSRVEWTLTANDGTAVVHVDDDGPGVPVAERERIFERFVRLDAARSRADGGSGLGLAIVAEVVAAHAGMVEVTDSPLGGARFTVRLPM
jgi:signal transduction histidine kinase